MTDAPIKPARIRFTRELTSIVGLPLVIWLVGWAPIEAFIAFVAVISAIALYEFLILGRKKGYPIHTPIPLILMLVLLATFVLEQVSVEVAVFAILLIIPAAYIFGRGDLPNALPATAVSTLSTLYIGMLGGALIRLRVDFGASGPKLVFFLLIVVWMGDAGAYYVGRRFGRRSLSPRVSPKKTIEGFIGGVASSLLGATVIHLTFFREFPLIHALAAASILSIAGVIGDLAESLWKRSADVKDSGTLIPGHGGFLDRIDSIFFTAPILYAYAYLLFRPAQG